ncbi:MAG: sigma-70 family RNA polymerase sigma factor [Caldithrix sp.]|nr:sigma-70 family RNA polymerase sigma factor [Caldithrix sp.]
MVKVENEVKSTQNETSDEQLIARFQKGDNYAFDLLVKRYKDPLMNFIFRFLGDKNEAEDIVQETFLRLYKNKHYYKEIAKFSTWIYTIASNLAKTELRKRKRRKFFSIHQFMQTEKDYDIPDDSFSPDQQANTVITDKLIQQAIDKLSPKFKQVIILRDIQEFSYEEIAEVVDIPLGTVKSRVNRARLKLQEYLKDLEIQP